MSMRFYIYHLSVPIFIVTDDDHVPLKDHISVDAIVLRCDE